MSGRKVEAVIFDLGGTISINPYALFEEYAASKGITMAAFGTVFRNGDPALAQMERGEIDMMTHLTYVADTVGAQNGIVLDANDIARVIRQCMTPNPPMVTMVEQIRQHHKVAILTNNTADLADHWRSLLPVDFVDVIVESFAVKMRKPDRDIYELTAERLGVPMEACIFVDDQADNVNAAIAYGMGGVIFKNAAQCQAELTAMGVHI